MRRKTLYILVAITLPVTALAVLLPAPQTRLRLEKGSGKLLPELAGKTGDVALMVVIGPDGKASLRRTGSQTWVLAEKSDYPVPETRVEPVLESLQKLRGIEPKTADASLYGRLDLGDPGVGSQSYEITVQNAKGKTLASVILGRKKSDVSGGGHDRIYARVPGTARSWLAEPAITVPDDWIDRHIVDIDPDKIKQIIITQADGATLTIARDKQGDKLTLRNLPTNTKLKSDTAADDIASAFQTLDLTDVMPQAKLNGTPQATAQATTFDGLITTLALSKQGTQTWLTATASGTGAGPIGARTKGWAYQVPDAKVASLESKLPDLVTGPPSDAKR
jgi:hypothetical protein